MIRDRINKLLKKMDDNNIDFYLIPSEDFHQSEYVGDYFKSREFISGFSGSAGFVIVSKNEICLWTDGRYFLQAEIELKDSGIKLQKMGQKNVPTLKEYLETHICDGNVLGFDGRTISVKDGIEYEKILNKKNGKIIYNLDLIGDIWEDRPSISNAKAFYLEEKYSGENTLSKLNRIREVMIKKGAKYHIISALDDVCWTFNFRGDDVKYSPLVLSYAIITLDKVYIFVDKNKLGKDILNSFIGIDYEIKEYNDIYEFIKLIKEPIMIDKDKLNYALYKNISKDTKVILEKNPAYVFKSIKNEIEIKNFKNAHIKDGVAWVKFMYWLKNNIGKMDIDEISASNKLEEFRKEQEGYLWPSFAPISGYAEHGAIVHYEATKKTNKKLEARGLYLSDTGSNFYEGTTDITRTIALGELTKDEVFYFTLVLKSHINLAKAKFPKGVSGLSLDALARESFWKLGLDFNHGTGHGVGYLLNVHEGPIAFRYKVSPFREENYPLSSGNVISIEPGIYIEGKFGIRLENLIVVREKDETDYGKFMYLEPLTLVPFDLDAVDFKLLNSDEIEYLNEYNKKIFETISPFLSKEEIEFLKKYTKVID